MGRLQRIALAGPSEVAWGRIISFLLMSSTSGEGGEAITLLLFSLRLLAATAAASLRVTYVYCIRGEWHNSQPSAHFSLSLSVFLAFLLGRVYRERQMPCCKSFLGDEGFFLFCFYLKTPKAIKVEAYLPLSRSVGLKSYLCVQTDFYAPVTHKHLLIIKPGGAFFLQCEITSPLKRPLPALKSNGIKC